MLIDLHAHTSGISKCCRDDAMGILKSASELGIDGIVLTNHYQKSYVEENGADVLIEKYIGEFYKTKEIGERIGMRVFWGLEVTMVLYPNVHMLIYGVDTEFIKKHPYVFDYTNEEIYAVVKENGGVLVQAHPFRNGCSVMDANFLDGIEINCHPIYKNSYSEEILNIAKENRLAVTCGGDFHADSYRPKCGAFIPDDVTDERQLGDYIKNAKTIDMHVQEPCTDIHKIINFDREF